MPLHAFRTRLVAGLALTIAIGVGATPASALGHVPSAISSAAAATPVAATPDDIPPVTDNPFLPDDRGVGECISALPKPDCGSKERGGWHQYLVFIALVGGLSVIGWRIVSGVRKGRPELVAPADRGRSTVVESVPSTIDTPHIDRS